MVARKNVHFEVQGLKGSSWTILKVEHDEPRALELAQKRWESGAFKAVKVTRERLNNDDGTYFSSEIFFKGKEKKRKDDDDDKGSAKGCWKPGDLYSFEGRRTLSIFLLSDLETWQITPIELTHCPDHYYRLDDNGMSLQNAVQRAAVEQIKGTQITVQDRMKDIYALIELAVDNLKEKWNSGDVPDLSKVSFREAIEALTDNESRAYFLTLGMVKHFQSISTIPEKMTLILDWIKLDLPRWALNECDGLIAELFASPSMVRSILGDAAGSAKPLRALASLTRGEILEGFEQFEYAKLAPFIKEGHLRQTKLAIYSRLTKELKSFKPLSGGFVLNELKAVGSILDTLRGPDDEKIPDLQLIDAIDERFAKNLNQESIGAYLKDVREPEEQIRQLLELDPHIRGETAGRKLANYIMPILTDSEYSAYFKAIDGNYLERMRTLSELQRSIIRTKLPEGFRKRMAERLDNFCSDIMNQTKLLQRIHKASNGDPIAAGKRLLQMIADGHFTIGNSGKMARATARNYMRVPNFIEKCVVGDTDAERAQSLLTLQKLLVKAGMTGKDGAPTSG